MSTITALSIGHTGITVSDLERSTRFYRDVLGFQISKPVQVSGPMFENITGVSGGVIDIAFARGLGQVIELLCFRQPKDRKTSTLRTCDPGFWHLCLKVRDIEQVVQAIRKSGFQPLSEIQTATDGPAKGLRVVYARDPDGVVLELMEEPPGFSLESFYLSTEEP